jgi:hypothetical protein
LATWLAGLSSQSTKIQKLWEPLQFWPSLYIYIIIIITIIDDYPIIIPLYNHNQFTTFCDIQRDLSQISHCLHRSRLEVVLSEKALLVLIQVFEHGLKQSIEATEVTVMCHKKIADWDENGRMNRTWRAHFQ